MMQDNVLFRFLMMPIDMRNTHWRAYLSPQLVIGVLVLLPIKLAFVLLAVAMVAVCYAPFFVIMSICAGIARLFGRKDTASYLFAIGFAWPMTLVFALHMLAGDSLAW